MHRTLRGTLVVGCVLMGVMGRQPTASAADRRFNESAFGQTTLTINDTAPPVQTAVQPMAVGQAIHEMVPMLHERPSSGSADQDRMLQERVMPNNAREDSLKESPLEHAPHARAYPGFSAPARPVSLGRVVHTPVVTDPIFVGGVPTGQHQVALTIPLELIKFMAGLLGVFVISLSLLCLISDGWRGRGEK